eukprot:2437761-Prorocentrum_lima.AAC.1
MKGEHPERTTVCRTRQNSLDKVNAEFPTLVLDDDTKSLSEPELEDVLGFLASFVDPSTATDTGPKSRE